ncbi:MAG: CehA/McbA family metallohydrolase [candidate division KSB1 bacterium]|jgi:histidinol phosphatase-like PHP family hydrolase|nr:CehA/McbA family metallohydrolase [candidate division KSB1 bacterium]
MFDVSLIIPFLLYAETHYSFKGIYSRLKKNEPEIVADAPHRIEPGKNIPIMLLFKDGHKHPVELIHVNIELIAGNQIVHSESHPLNFNISGEKYQWLIFNMESDEALKGPVQADVSFEIEVNGRRRMYRNDNYRLSSHKPLDIYIATEPLPATEHWFFGDMHSHSAYTEDQAEFGAPLAPSVELCRSMGLTFFAATDHSYDLDDMDSSYLKNDPELKKWHRFRADVASLNQKRTDFVVIPGEEVSGGNEKNRNVHLLVLNSSAFIPGKGDSAERWFRTRPDLSLKQIMNFMEKDALAIAAHPGIPPPFLEWLLIRRGRWEGSDYQHDRLTGMQIWNGLDDDGFAEGVRRWIDLLLSGRRIYIFAGNDAHGNFNRFRQIGFPFFTFREHSDQIFGKMRTGLRIENSLSLASLMHAVRNGNAVISNGPFVDFNVRNTHGECTPIGELAGGDAVALDVRCRSSHEFGRLARLAVLIGDLRKREERLFRVIDEFDNPFSADMGIDIHGQSGTGYVRMELSTWVEGQQFRCLTNPIWFGKA